VKVLFISTPSHDLASIFLYDGLCDLVGEANVKLAEPYPYLDGTYAPGARLLDRRRSIPRTLATSLGHLFNLVVLNASCHRDHNFEWAATLIKDRLAPNGVVAYVEGWDDATNEVFPCPPTFPVTRVFRREVLPGHPYPYYPTPLLWAAPQFWFDEPRPEKTIDVSCLCSLAGAGHRWAMMAKVFQATTRHCAVIGGPIHYDQYLWVTKRSKWVIIPPGGGSDCVRQWEAIAYGAIPIFVGHPPRVREPWFAEGEILECTVEDLPRTLDYALSNIDWPAMQARLEKRARHEHTTKARAKRLVELTGVQE